MGKEPDRSERGAREVAATIDGMTASSAGWSLLLDAVLENCPHGIAVCDRQGRMLVWNAAATRIFGGPVRHDGVEEWRNAPAFHPDGRPMELAEYPMVRALRFGEVIESNEMVMMDSEGRRKHLLGGTMPLRDADGGVAGAVSVFTDVTAQRETEQRLRRLQSLTSRLSAALDASAVADAVTGDNAAVVGATRARLWQDDADGATPAGRAIATGAAVWAEEAGERVVYLPLRVDRRALGCLEMAFAGARERDDREDEFLDAVAQQVAQALDRARLHDAERAARHEAEAAVALRDEFFSIAAHELRTPLTPLVLESQVLERLARRDGMAAVLVRATRLSAHVRRMTRQVEEMLDVSRIASGRLELRPEEIELGALVADVVARMREELDQASVEVRVDRPGAVHGRWDRTRLEQVISNVIGNAVKYGRDRPVDVRVEPRGERAVLVVRDEGIGIAPADQARIFERFERAASSRHFAGLGLGLWIARQIVHAHGGTIAVTSALGDGATFVVELPR